jgi:hypothetical protein
MPGQVPPKIWLFRIVHYENVRHILQHGMYSREHPDFDPDYKNIGDRSLIEQRNDYPIKLAGKGALGEYIPFYFWGHSPMLLNIISGFRGIEKRPERDIVYICCSLDSIEQAEREYLFTNGHAKDRITDFFDDKSRLDEIDWDAVKARQWRSDDSDWDRQRKKQAEFLVKEHVPVQCIERILVWDEERYNYVKNIVDNLQLNIEVFIDKKGQFYYR